MANENEHDLGRLEGKLDVLITNQKTTNDLLLKHIMDEHPVIEGKIGKINTKIAVIVSIGLALFEGGKKAFVSWFGA